MPRTPIFTAFASIIALAVGGILLSPPQRSAASETPPSQPSEPKAEFDRDTMHLQVLLDRAGFSPGIIDAKKGKNLESALRGFQEANDLEVTGTADPETRQLLLAHDPRQATRRLRLDPPSFGRPFVMPIPKNPEEKAKLDALNYRNLLEEYAERFHTTPEVLIALNGGDAPIGVGQVLEFPNVLPRSRDYGDQLSSEHREMFNALNVEPQPARGDHIIVDKSDSVLRVFDADDKLVAQFPVTTGSEKDPLPLGNWKVTTYAFLPPFDYQPDLFWDVDDGDAEVSMPPGPNGPVGVAWLDLTKEHYGIHGTPDPSTIGYTQSHGCIRMTNWDVLTLTRMLKPGFKAKFQA